MNVLIVDDDAGDRQLVKRSLNKGGGIFALTEATNVDDALDQVRRVPFDVVLLDYCMPKRNGIEMLRELSSWQPERSQAVVMISDAINEQLALSCIKAGAQDFVLKSEISSERLRRTILQAQLRFKLERELHQSYRKVKDLAETDSLTGLTNRHVFDESLRLAVANNRRGEHKVALILIDLDHFKYINDTHGHDAGDHLLKRVVNRLRGCLRGNELFSRVGGDELAILLTNLIDDLEAMKVATRVQACMTKPFAIDNVGVKMSCSIGVAVHPDNATTAEELFKFADIALYRAKDRGRNKIRFFESRMQQAFVRRYELDQALHSADFDRDFVLHYQPVFCTGAAEPMGFEALLRWRNNGRLRYPPEFMTVAEESNFVLRLDNWVLDQACAQLRRWCDTSGKPLVMAVNISMQHLADYSLPDYLEECLHRHGVDPSQLVLELTETSFPHTAERIAPTVKAIHTLGIGLALDDFGTGFSSISHLLEYPVTCVKIDKSLLAGHSASVRQDRLFRALVLMVQALDLPVVVEGVEYETQDRLCRELRVEYVQGFYYAKAEPPATVEEQFGFGQRQH